MAPNLMLGKRVCRVFLEVESRNLSRVRNYCCRGGSSQASPSEYATQLGADPKNFTRIHQLVLGRRQTVHFALKLSSAIEATLVIFAYSDLPGMR